MVRPKPLDAFTRAYIEAALWSSSDSPDDESEPEPLDRNYSASDIAPETMAAMIEDCADFQKRFGHLIEDEPTVRGEDKWGRDELAGHDFWLTRAESGAGFWDGGWPKHGDELTKASKEYGGFELYVGDDGVIYAVGHEGGAPASNGVTEAKRRSRGGWWIHWNNHSENGPFSSRGEAKQYADFWASQPNPKKLTFTIDQVPGWDERMGPRPSGQTVRDYVPVDHHGRPLGPPVTDYSAAKRKADQARGYVKFASKVKENVATPPWSPDYGRRTVGALRRPRRPR